jgi:5,10-methylenetetrahydrofolate reductase
MDIDCVQLVNLVHALNSGKDMAGNELSGGTGFCVGVSAACGDNPLEPPANLEKKLAAGVDFVQTQAVFDIDDLKRLMGFIKKQDQKVKAIAGITPLVSVAMGRYMNSNMPGVCVPDRLLTEMASAPKGRAISTGIEIAARMIRQIKDTRVCDGVHIMFIGREERIPEVIEAAGLMGVTA